jgi:hypothetical protein
MIRIFVIRPLRCRQSLTNFHLIITYGNPQIVIVFFSFVNSSSSISREKSFPKSNQRIQTLTGFLMNEQNHCVTLFEAPQVSQFK